MTTSEIFIRTQGKEYGPYNETDLKTHLKAGRIPFSAWIYVDKQWRLLAELPELRKTHPEFEDGPTDAPHVSKATSLPEPPSRPRRTFDAPSGGTRATVSAEPVWFFIRDRKKFGPYSAAELVSQLQRKQLDATTFVWRPGFATWQRMSQVSEFSRDSMRRLADEGVPLDILVKRKYARAPYEVEVIAHDNTRAIEGKSMVIGEGGLFLATPKPQHIVGARLKLHFRESDAPAFNAVAEVVSVVRGETPGYCLRFVALSEGDRRKIAKFVSDRRKA